MLPTFLVSEWVFDGKADPVHIRRASASPTSAPNATSVQCSQLVL
jgi:hypothetical protein